MRYFVRRGNDGGALYLLRIRPDGRVLFFTRGRWIERRGPYSADDFRLRRTATDYRYRALYAGAIDYDELTAEQARVVARELRSAVV